MSEQPEVRHIFQGSPLYRWFLLVVGLAMAVLLIIGGTVFSADANWARQLCPLVGALSAALFACLVGIDIYRPRSITPSRMKMAVRAFLTLPAIAIILAVIGFFV